MESSERNPGVVGAAAGASDSIHQEAEGIDMQSTVPVEARTWPIEIRIAKRRKAYVAKATDGGGRLARFVGRLRAAEDERKLIVFAFRGATMDEVGRLWTIGQLWQREGRLVAPSASWARMDSAKRGVWWYTSAFGFYVDADEVFERIALDLELDLSCPVEVMDARQRDEVAR